MDDDTEFIEVPDAPPPPPPIDPAVAAEAETAKDEANTNFKGITCFGTMFLGRTNVIGCGGKGESVPLQPSTLQRRLKAIHALLS